jgi:hypothetical protein
MLEKIAKALRVLGTLGAPLEAHGPISLDCLSFCVGLGPRRELSKVDATGFAIVVNGFQSLMDETIEEEIVLNVA